MTCCVARRTGMKTDECVKFYGEKPKDMPVEDFFALLLHFAHDVKQCQRELEVRRPAAL